MRRVWILLAVGALAATACSNPATDSTATSGAAPTTTPPSSTTTAADLLPLVSTSSTTSASTTSTTTSSTTTSTTTTTTTVPYSPVNGLIVDDAELRDRRVIAVKIDNHPKARRQSGLQEADAVIELLVEGVTRFIALFHTSDSTYLGPVRSIRPTDSTLLRAFGAAFVVSGGQEWVKAITTERGVDFVTEGVSGLYRISTRVAPQNLYADTTELRATADDLGFSDTVHGPLLVFGEWETAPAATASQIDLYWAVGAQVRWLFSEGRYYRLAQTTPHRWVDLDGNTDQLAFDVLVVLEGIQYTARPGSGYGGSSVPATETLGGGRMAVFSNGYVVEGTWERSAITEPFHLFDDSGNPVTIPPGIPWISIYPEGVDWRWR